MSDAKHWKPETPKNQTRFWLSLLIGWTLGALCIALALGLHKTPPRLSTMPDLQSAKSLFVVVDSPSTELLEQLRVAYENGVHIQMVTSDSIEMPYKISVVSKDKIVHNAILLNGSAWYPLP